MSPVNRFFRKIGYLLRLRLETEPGIVWRIAVAALAWLIRLHGLTLRYRVDDKAGYLTGKLNRPVTLLLWHNRIFATPAFYERHCRNGRKAFVLTSAGPEGSLLALLMAHFGIGSVRGSTSRRASVALREMATLLTNDHDVIMTPDGPRGPRYRLQPGALFLAQTTGCMIITVHIECSRFWRLKTWDGFALPFPFSRVEFIFDEPFPVAAKNSPEETERERSRIEAVMKRSLLMD